MVVHVTAERIELKPSFLGFMSRYLSALLPIILVMLLMYASNNYGIKGSALESLVYVTFGGLIVLSWVMRNHTALFSFILTIVFTVLGIRFGYLSTSNLILSGLMKSSLFASILMFLYTELFRDSITYTIDAYGIQISGGVVKSEKRFIPYNQLSDIVLEKSIFDHIFGTGKILLVTTGGWGSEYYTRGVGAGGGKKVIGGVYYSRTLKEVSRDPLNCIYFQFF